MLRSHLIYPFLFFAVIATLLELSAIDLWVADWIYHWSGGIWHWRDAWLTAELIHQDGRALVGLMVVVLLVVTVVSFPLAPLQPYRRGLIYVLCSALVSGLLINVLKRLTHVDCPWDLQRYGGAYEYSRTFVHVFAPHLRVTEGGECFPAGHASAGYSWFGLYFLARHYWPAWRYQVLATVLLLGLVFGLGQQLRGAHFLSHDLWTLGLCWFTATLLAFVFLPASTSTTA
jgi:membrane-associated PAP2 superfamily phosphatase